MVVALIPLVRVIPLVTLGVHLLLLFLALAQRFMEVRVRPVHPLVGMAPVLLTVTPLLRPVMLVTILIPALEFLV